MKDIVLVIYLSSILKLFNFTFISLTRFDLMMGINTRGTYCVTQACLPYLKKSSHAHVLNNSPPLNMKPIWFKNHVAYTMAKYGMSMCVLGMAEEFRAYKIGRIALFFCFHSTLKIYTLH
jgi:NAD(P)-dependent dehydrogenase (short-subunit alcohol dehydrogenase family)